MKTAASDPFTQTPAGSHARVDPLRLDHYLAIIDRKLARQIDAILHHPAFQALESAWRGLQFLVDRTDFRRNVCIEVLDVSKETLREDFEDAPDLIQSGLFQLTYAQEYDTPGAYPIAAIIANYEFDAGTPDIALLRNLSKVAAAAHMPFIGAVSPAFFGRSSMEEVSGIRDLAGYFENARPTSSGRRFGKRRMRAMSDSRYPGFSCACRMGPIRIRCGVSTTPKTCAAAAATLFCGRTRHLPSP